MPKADISFKDLKLDANGLIPVVVQDYVNDEVLMLAYMNEEAYNKTLETGIMTYYSRSRQELLLTSTVTMILFLQRFVRLVLHATLETEHASIEILKHGTDNLWNINI